MASAFRIAGRNESGLQDNSLDDERCEKTKDASKGEMRANENRAAKSAAR